ALGDRLREGGTPDAQLVLAADALVPAAEQEAGIVDVVVEVVMGEEQVIDAGGTDPRLHQLVGGGGAAVEHEVPVGHLDGEGGSPAIGGGSRRAGSEDEDLGHDWTSLPAERDAARRELRLPGDGRGNGSDRGTRRARRRG